MIDRLILFLEASLRSFFLDKFMFPFIAVEWHEIGELLGNLLKCTRLRVFGNNNDFKYILVTEQESKAHTEINFCKKKFT